MIHPQHLEGLVISNMMASIPAYNAYARQTLMPAMDQKALGEIQALEAKQQFEDPRYMALLMEHHYVHHILRMPPDHWPDPVMRAFKHLNPKVYVPVQGPSELGASGILERWDRTADLQTITVPTLVIGAAHDTMDPRHMSGWPVNCRTAGICSAPAAATWPCTTIRRPTWRGSCGSFAR